MVAIIEKGSFIPIPDTTLTTPTGERFVQIQKIPVITREETFPPTIHYASFNYSPVEIAAGGETMELAQQRIRWQMVYRYKRALAALKDQSLPSNTVNEIKVISVTSQFINLL